MAEQNPKLTDSLKVRRAVSGDIEAVQALINEYAFEHPAEHHPRPLSVIETAYFGRYPASYILIAERHAVPVGFGAWHRVFDMLWAQYGGEMDGLYVKPAQRGRGIAANIVAAVCADIRKQGGVFLRATYTDTLGSLYERVAVGSEQRECHLSASAFQAVADLTDCGPRELLRRLPAKNLNYIAPTDAG